MTRLVGAMMRFLKIKSQSRWDKWNILIKYLWLSLKVTGLLGFANWQKIRSKTKDRYKLSSWISFGRI